MKLDLTAKRIGLALRQRAIPIVDDPLPRRMDELLARLHDDTPAERPEQNACKRPEQNA